MGALMGWLVLIAAGLVEIAWSQSIKPTENFIKPLPTLLCVVLGVAAVYLLSRAMDTVPVGTAYAVFTGIGAVGAIVLGVVVRPAGRGTDTRAEPYRRRDRPREGHFVSCSQRNSKTSAHLNASCSLSAAPPWPPSMFS